MVKSKAGPIRATVILFLLFLIFHPAFPSLCRGQSKAYRIGPNDVISIVIRASGEKQHETDLTVSSQGFINAPFIGPIRAEGLTPNELEKKLTVPLAEHYFVNPQVDIHVKEYHSLHYSISGAVKEPGLYKMSTEIRLLDLITKAGGLLPDHATIAYIVRGSANLDPEDLAKKNLPPQTKSIKVDLKRLLERGDMSANLVLISGDLVYIPLMTSLDISVSKVYVDGEVKTPGVYNYRPGMTAMNACLLAGGFGTFAAENRTRIIRKKGDRTEIININLKEVSEGKRQDIELQPGDRIHVPESWL
ncbi:SLBB domain-containing protein [Patescibacteria group bacterium]|nr:SLBB domain-containing protein [Patescibacteria group bacterium]